MQRSKVITHILKQWKPHEKTGKWPEMIKNDVGQVRVAGGDCGQGGGRCQSQKEDFGKGKLSGWSALRKDTHWNQKIA